MNFPTHLACSCCYSQFLKTLPENHWGVSVHFSSVTQSCPTLQPHGLQHTRLPYHPSPTPRAYSVSCPLSRWCHPTILSSVEFGFFVCFFFEQEPLIYLPRLSFSAPGSDVSVCLASLCVKHSNLSPVTFSFISFIPDIDNLCAFSSSVLLYLFSLFLYFVSLISGLCFIHSA